jgi:hypothetical protein
VAANVRHLWMMAGHWPRGSENNFNRNSTVRNAAVLVISRWPTPITFLGFEVGGSVHVGGNLRGTAHGDPVALTLQAHGSEAGRSVWDPMLIWLACLGDPTRAGYQTVQGIARVNVVSVENTWEDGRDGTHCYIVKTMPDEWYVADLNARVQPGSVVCQRDWVAGSQPDA